MARVHLSIYFPEPVKQTFNRIKHLLHFTVKTYKVSQQQQNFDNYFQLFFFFLSSHVLVAYFDYIVRSAGLLYFYYFSSYHGRCPEEGTNQYNSSIICFNSRNN